MCLMFWPTGPTTQNRQEKTVSLYYLWLRLRSSDEELEAPEKKKQGDPPWPTSSPPPKANEVVVGAGAGAAAAAAEAMVVVVVALTVGVSTGFLERLRPRCMWRSQYLWPGKTSLEHLHFLPSVLLHLPGSGSIAPFPIYPMFFSNSYQRLASRNKDPINYTTLSPTQIRVHHLRSEVFKTKLDKSKNPSHAFSKFAKTR